MMPDPAEHSTPDDATEFFDHRAITYQGGSWWWLWTEPTIVSRSDLERLSNIINAHLEER